eukprot:2922053-Amphidinium_carterae.2
MCERSTSVENKELQQSSGKSDDKGMKQQRGSCMTFRLNLELCGLQEPSSVVSRCTKDKPLPRRWMRQTSPACAHPSWCAIHLTQTTAVDHSQENDYILNSPSTLSCNVTCYMFQNVMVWLVLQRTLLRSQETPIT